MPNARRFQSEKCRKRVAIVLPNMAGGGVERVRLLLAEQFLARGFGVDFVLAEQRGELLGEVPSRCDIVNLDAPRLRSVPLRLRKYLIERRPDAVLAAMWPLTGLVGLSLRLARMSTPLVVSEHADLRDAIAIKAPERLLLKLFGPWLYGRAQAVVAVSRGVRESLIDVADVPPNCITVIYNPVRQSAGSIEPDDESLIDWWQQAETKVIAVGGLKREKDYPTLLKAVELVRKTRDARLIVLGDGPEREKLERLAESSGLRDAVRFPGFRANPQPYLRRADVCALSSRFEGLGNIIIEALAAGCRVVATNCRSGPSELLAGGTYGRLVPVADSRKLAESLLEAARNAHDPTPGIEWASRFNPEDAAISYLQLMFPDEAWNGSPLAKGQ